jgi:hypothetical protein
VSYFEKRVQALAERSGPTVFGLLGWFDTRGQLWIAPLGTQEPSVGEPVPAAWVPFRRIPREDAA